MKLNYVGPKPIISHTGIEFDNNKEDEFVYLNIVVQLLKALSKDTFKDKTYIYDSNSDRLTLTQLLIELKIYCPNINLLMEKESNNAEKEIEHNLQRVHENAILSDEDKRVLENNINIMSHYLVQYSINKGVYCCAINALSKLVKKDHIDCIIVPMFQKFTHVLYSIQENLNNEEFPIDTKIEIFQEDEKLLAKLSFLT